MGLSTELLAQAKTLARREPRRPKQASLRRSISASYYALFHFLGEEATKLAVGTAHEKASLRKFASRALIHGKMKTVCDEFSRSVPRSELLKPFWAPMQVSANAEIKTIAANFIDLQESRHSADYDLARKFTRTDAENAAAQAQDSIDAWKTLRVANAPLAQLFSLSLLLWSGLGSR